MAVGLDQAVEPHSPAVVVDGTEQPHEGGVGGADEALRITVAMAIGPDGTAAQL